jgi:ubiquinone/menaquinone biosynthesis C-methylase UbiE
MPINPNAAQPENWYSKVFARIYDPFMEKMEERVLLKRRRSLLESLPGDILEVGAGTGTNFPLYGRDARVIAIEPAGQMLKRAREKLEAGPFDASFELIEAGIGDDAVAAAIPAEGLDAVVFTLVLCTIPDPESALRQCIQWLKPGGKVVMLEHIASGNQWGYLLQKTIDPVWKHLAEGCHLDRHTDQLIQRMGLTKVSEEHFTKALPFYKAVWQK